MTDRISPCGFAYSEGYSDTIRDVIIPYNNAHRKDEHFDGYDGNQLFTSIYTADSPKASITLVHGFTECAEKYQEPIYSLLTHGYNVYAYDARGHARSWRDSNISDMTLTHIEHFDEYVKDLDRFASEYAEKDGLPKYIFGHSMGGATVALYLEQYSEKNLFEKAVLSSPMIAPSTSFIPARVAKMLCRGNIARGKERERIFVSQPYPGVEKFEDSCCTGKERFDWFEQIRESNPDMQNYSPTYQWTLESLGVKSKILKPKTPERIKTKVKLYQAELDTVVINKYQNKFISRVPDGEKLVVKGAKHEIYRSDDETVFSYWTDVLEFLAK